MTLQLVQQAAHRCLQAVSALWLTPTSVYMTIVLRLQGFFENSLAMLRGALMGVWHLLRLLGEGLGCLVLGLVHFAPDLMWRSVL